MSSFTSLVSVLLLVLLLQICSGFRYISANNAITRGGTRSLKMMSVETETSSETAKKEDKAIPTFLPSDMGIDYGTYVYI